MLRDHVWDLLAPATVAFENVSRNEVESGIANGDFQLFISEHSAAVTCAFGRHYGLVLQAATWMSYWILRRTSAITPVATISTASRS
jgi:hypothetical protein